MKAFIVSTSCQMGLNHFASNRSLCAKALEASGISSLEANTPALRIPAAKVSRFWNWLSASQRDPSLGFKVALNVPFGAYLVPNLMAAGSKTVGEGLTRACHNYSLIHSSARLQIKKLSRCIRIEFIDDKNESSSRQYVQYVLTTLVCHSRNATGIDWNPILLRSRNKDFSASKEFQDFFGGRLAEYCENDGFDITLKVWNQKNQRHIPGILEILESESVRQQKSHQSMFSFSGITEQMVKVSLGNDSITIKDIAKRMSVSVRSLQRRLAEERTSFEAIVEDARRSLAHSYLTDSSLTKSQIAYLLGYSEPSAFLRALKRWKKS